MYDGSIRQKQSKEKTKQKQFNLHAYGLIVQKQQQQFIETRRKSELVRV